MRRAKLFWSWEIVRNSQALPVKVHGNGFASAATAKLAGEKALRELLDELGDVSPQMSDELEG